MIVIEKKIVKVDTDCKKNPVFVSWLNTLGGREHWLFHKIQTEALVTAEAGTFEPFREDIETARGKILDLSVSATPKLVVFALPDIEDLKGLETIMYSNMVEILMNPETWEAEGPKWQIVRPEKGSFQINNTDQIKADLEITFTLPYLNVQQR